MDIRNRLRFVVGIIVVIGVVAALFLYLNYSMSNIQSRQATLETDSYAVISEYGGVLKQSYVAPGDTVKKGDKLFELDSQSLAQALRNDQLDKTALPFEVTKSGNMVLLATVPGKVQQINFADGAFIAANAGIATIATENSQYITARYLLNAPDYARINRDNPVYVTLPDNTRLEATVFDISLEQDDEEVYTIVKARLPEDASILPTFSSGTPVSTTWQLDNSDWQESIIRFLRSLIAPRSEVE